MYRMDGGLLLTVHLTTCTDGSQVSWISAVVAAIMATAAYVILNGVFHSVLEPYMIHTSVGTETLLILWFGAAFGVVSGPLWLLSVCCC
jgi:hypothetical protein